MHAEVVERLLDINRGFYQSFAEPFRASRGRLQPGVARALTQVELDADLLDLGCGHGLLAEALHQRGFSGRYVGLDASSELLGAIPAELQPPHFHFARADLAGPEWGQMAESPLVENRNSNNGEEPDRTGFDWAFAFAVLHHIPSSGLRAAVAERVRSLLKGGGRFAVSVWDFLASPRIAERIVKWQAVDLEDSQVEEGDYLIEWREGGRGFRYVHHFTEHALAELAAQGGFRVIEQYRSDGENGRLGIYQIWEAAEGKRL